MTLFFFLQLQNITEFRITSTTCRKLQKL